MACFLHQLRPGDNNLHVILVHFNPRRLKVRTRLFKETAERLAKDGAIVWRVECAFDDRPYEVTNWWHPHHIRVRTNEELWNKEALINIGANTIFKKHPNAKYLAWIDADIQFVRTNWVNETVEQLKHHKVVQLFSNAIDLNPKYDFMGRAHGFAKLWIEGQKPGDFEKNKNKYPSHMHPGYGWAYRSSVWQEIGGMLTVGILGSGDSHMAASLVGLPLQSVWEGLHPNYAKAIQEWADKADSVVQKDIGYVDGLILHHFHGYKEHRGYKTRVDILRKYLYDPEADLHFDKNGLPYLSPIRRTLKSKIREYMGSRKEYDLTTALETS
jgi:hypothetical protein